MEILLDRNELPRSGSFLYKDFPDFKIELLIYNLNGKIRIFSSFCPHFGGKLEIVKDNLYCYFHDYFYDLNTLSCTNKNFGAKCHEYYYFEEKDHLIIEVT
jgi:nitrite reductase/ring-hydroxylating ferredoxin subunit